jgi:hypothetical protein
LAPRVRNLLGDGPDFGAGDEDEDAGQDQEDVGKADEPHDDANASSCTEVAACALRHLGRHVGCAERQAAHNEAGQGGQKYEQSAEDEQRIAEWA